MRRVHTTGEAAEVCTVADFRFPRGARLTRKPEFDRVFKRPRFRFRIGPLRLLAARNRMCAPRLGVVAPRRVLRRAIDRNRAKRHIRESFRYARGRLPNCDIVVVVSGHADGGTIKATQVRRAAEKLWDRLSRKP